MLLAKDIRDRERGGRAEIRVTEGDEESNCPQNMELLNGVLGERTSKLVDGPPDETADQEQKSKLTLYQWAVSPLCWSIRPIWVLFVSSYLHEPLFHRVSDAEGQMKITEVATRPLTQDLLSHDVSSTDQIKDVCTVNYGQLKMDVDVQNLLWSFYNPNTHFKLCELQWLKQVKVN